MAYNQFYDNLPVEQTAPAPAPMQQSFAPSPYMADSPAVAREVAQVQAQIIIAKRFPRDENASLMKIDRACSREKLANSALYTYSRGGAEVRGASIRLAETVANAWGNIKYGYEPVDSNENETTVRSYCYDMETNTVAERSFKVPHVRYTSGGGVKKLVDPRDIYEAVANQASRRVRACILEVIPGDIVEHAVDVCQKTQKAKVKITPESLAALCEAFSQFGVAKMQIEAFIQRNLEAVTIDQYLRLRQIYQGLVGGMSKVSDFFRPLEEVMAERGEKTKEAPQSDAKAPQTEAEPAPAEAMPPKTDDAPTGGPEDFQDDDINGMMNF